MAGADTILEAGATIDVAPYQAGLDKMVESTTAATASVKGNFESVAAADAAVSAQVQSLGNTTANSLVRTGATGIFAFDAVRAKVIETTAEVAKLRAEILETNDAAKLEQLQAQLRRASQEMTAARTEMRALRFEAAETKEKADLLGESFGVKIPGALGTLLGRLPLLQEAMAAAFAVGVVGIFIDVLLEAPEAIGKIVDKLVEWDEAAKKVYENQIRYNDEIIKQNIELAKKQGEIALIGTEGARREAGEVANLRNEQKLLVNDYNERKRQIQDINTELEKLHANQTEEERAALGARAGEAKIGQDVINWATRANVQIEQLQKRLEDLNNQQDKNAERQKEIAVIEQPRQAATSTKDERERELRDETATTETRKKIADSYIEYYLAGVKREYAAGKINLDEEVADERTAIEQKLAIDRKASEDRIAILTKQGATGKDVTPALAAERAQMEAEEIKTQSQLADIDAAADRKRIDHANSVSLALAQATKSGTDLEVGEAEAAARRQVEARKITIAQETTTLTEQLNKRLDAERAVAQEELRIANQRPGENQAKIVALNQELTNIESKRIADTEAIREAGDARERERLRREEEETLRFTRETTNLQLETIRRTDETRLRAHEITLSQWTNDETAALTRWYDAQHATLEKAAQDAAKMFGQESLEYRKVLNEMMILDQRFAADSQRIDEKIGASFQQTMNVISHSFTSAFDRMLTEHTRFSTVMANFWDQMVQGWARMGIQIVADYVQSLAKILIQEALTALRIQVIHTQTTTVKQATDNLYDNFLNALGIKRAARQATTDTQETVAHRAAALSRQAIDTTTAAQEATLQTAQLAKTTVVETTETAQHAAGQTAQVGATVAGQAAQTAAATSGSATRSGVGLLADLKSIGSAAATAAAHAFKWVMEEVPFPANVALAPAVAAATFAGVLAFKAFASAEKGAVLGADTLVAAHAKEMILPPPISTGLQNVISAGGFTPPPTGVAAGLAAPPAGSGSSSSTSTVTNKTIHVAPKIEIHSHGVEDHEDMHEKIVDVVKRAIRAGSLKAA